jgi:hypothetical protein
VPEKTVNVVKMPADGNCFYHFVGHVLEIDKQSEIRANIHKYLQNYADFSPLVKDQSKSARF